jgi:DNA-binding SARP family transcriptional activator
MFCVLGRIAVTADGSELDLGATREAALLADLLLHANQTVATDRLIDDVWQGEPPPGASATLHTYVKNLRRRLEPSRSAGSPSEILLTRRPGYQLRVAADSFDLWRTERLIELGRQSLAGGAPAAAADQLREALALWRGPAFGALADEPFLRAEATRLEGMRLVAIEARAEAELLLGEQAALCAQLEQLVDEHPYRERLWELWMLALYQSGRQTDALRAFERVRRSLAEDLGISPGEPLVRLEQAILRHDPALIGVGSTGAGTGAGRPAPVVLSARMGRADVERFVGRQGELTRLLDLLATVAKERRRRIVLLSGEPGIGKTTLAAAFARAARERGCDVIDGRCHEDLGVPYQPWATALAHLIDHSRPGRLDATLAACGADLAPLGPELADLAARAPAERDPELARYLLFGAVLRLLDAASRDRPVVVILDDLHWSDRPSLQLLRHVAAAEQAVPFLLVGTFRTSDVDDALRQLLAALHGEPGVTRLELLGLDRGELTLLVEATCGMQPGEGGSVVSEALAQETDGNPFFTGEVIRHLLEQGSLARDEAGRWAISDDVATAGVPVSVREVVSQRVANLGADAVHVLSVASVLGRDFDADVLAGAADRTEAQVLDVLETAAAANLVVNLSGEGCSFTHALVGHALHDGLAPARRVQLHARIAEVLESHGAARDHRVAELAFHYAEACSIRNPGAVLGKAVRCARDAGDVALRGLAPDLAVRWYRVALELLERSPEVDPAARCTLLVRLGDGLRQSGDPTSSDTLMAAGRLAQELGDTDALVAAALANNRGIYSTTGFLADDRFAHIEAALEAVGPIDSRQRARLLGLLAVESLTTRSAEERRTLVDEAIGIARRLDDPQTLLDVLVGPLEAVRFPESLVDRLATTAEAEQLAIRLEDRVGLFWASFQRTFAATELGDLVEADRCHAQATRLAADLGQPTMRWLVKLNETWRVLLRGDAEQAELDADEALRWGETTGQPDAGTLHHFQIHIIRWHQGRGAEVVDWLTELADRIPLQLFRSAAARVSLDVGRRDDASRLLRGEASAGFDHLGDMSTLATMGNWAEVATGLGDRGAAELLRARLLPWAAQVICTRTHVAGAVAHHVGVLQAACGDVRAAVHFLERALRLHEELRAPFHRARTHLALGRTLLTDGPTLDVEAARRHLSSASEIAAAYGCEFVRAGADALLADVDGPSGRPC